MLQGNPLHKSFQTVAKALLAVLALAASAAWADPPARVGRISETQGTVWFYEREQGEWVQAQRNWPVTDGDRFTTDRGARVEVQVGSATVHIGGSSELAFTELDDEHIRLQLDQGSVALHLRRDELARDVAVITSQGRFEPLRAGRYRVDVQERSVFGASLSGAMRYEARDSALTIEEGQRAEFWKEPGERTNYAWTDVPDDGFAEWVRQEEREDRYERERYDRWSSPEMTGADDLHRHGQWGRHPEFGTIWYPHSVGAGWVPYRDGRWAYVRPWGWTWVDNAPWGFAPFHYGRWVNYRGRWGWCPGQVVGRPVYSPALVGWIGNGNVSISIRAGHPGYVGWVPLSPYDVYHPHYHVPVTPVFIRNVNVPHHRWHRQPHPGRPHIMQGGVQYTNQGVAGGVTVVDRNVLRQRTPISAAVVAEVAPATVATWQRVQPQALEMIDNHRANQVATPAQSVPRLIAPPLMPGRGDDGQEGLRRGATVKSVAPTVTPMIAPAAPVMVMPAQTTVRTPGAIPVPIPGNSQGPIPTTGQPVPAMAPYTRVERVQSPAMQRPALPAPSQTPQDRMERQRDERQAQEQGKEQRREQMHRMQRHDLPGQQRNN